MPYHPSPYFRYIRNESQKPDMSHHLTPRILPFFLSHSIILPSSYLTNLILCAPPRFALTPSIPPFLPYHHINTPYFRYVRNEWQNPDMAHILTPYILRLFIHFLHSWMVCPNSLPISILIYPNNHIHLCPNTFTTIYAILEMSHKSQIWLAFCYLLSCWLFTHILDILFYCFSINKQ